MEKLKSITRTNPPKSPVESPMAATSPMAASPLRSDLQPTRSLVQPSPKKNKQHHRKPKAVRAFRSMIRALPILTPKTCRFPSLPGGLPDVNLRGHSGNRVTGTLFGYKKGKVTLSLQQTTKSLPNLVMELPIQTNVLQKEMGLGMVRIALECEKREEKDKVRLLEEPMWVVFYNGKKFGYAVKRDANEEDLTVMELLKVITMGIGVLPSAVFTDGDEPDDELVYIRANFEHHVGSKDSETLYMICPEGNNVPELTVFFVRI